MLELAARLRALLQRRDVLVAWTLLVVASCALCAFPLLEQPGYELASVLAVVHGLGGGLFALAAARREPAPSWRGAVAALLLLWVALVPPWVAATLRTWATGPCDPFATAAFFPVLTLPSAFLSVAAGAAVARWVRPGWPQGLAWLAVVLACLAHALLPLYLGPQVFLFSHLLGYLPGPLYDEELHLPAALLWLRLGTVLLGVALLSVAARPARWGLALPAAVGFLVLELAGTRLGFRASDAALEAHLPVVRASPEVIVRFAAGTPDEQVERAFLDARFRVAQVTRFLGGAQPGPVTVWWYPSSADKQRWVGAAHTQFAKPWRREVHVNASPGPHPVLRHELVHALAAPFGAAPFGVAAGLGGLLPNLGLIEGLAVAADSPGDDLDLLQSAAAMRRQGLLPDVRTLLTPAGFSGAPAARAYTAAGAFLRFLVEQHGAQAVRTLYARGDFQAAFHRDVTALARDFEAALDALPLAPAQVNQTRARFRRGSLFQRPCAREVALLTEAAGAAEPGVALERWRRCRVLQPREPAHALAEARALQALHRDGEALAALDALLALVEEDDATWSEAALERAGVALRLHDVDRARALWEGIVARAAPPPFERTARVRLAGLSLQGAPAAAVTSYFEARGPARLRALREGAAHGGWAVAYLLGRALAQEGVASEALDALEGAVAFPDCPRVVAQEARRLAQEAASQAGRCERLEAFAADASLGGGLQTRARDWLERCRFH